MCSGRNLADWRRVGHVTLDMSHNQALRLDFPLLNTNLFAKVVQLALLADLQKPTSALTGRFTCRIFSRYFQLKNVKNTHTLVPMTL